MDFNTHQGNGGGGRGYPSSASPAYNPNHPYGGVPPYLPPGSDHHHGMSILPVASYGEMEGYSEQMYDPYFLQQQQQHQSLPSEYGDFSVSAADGGMSPLMIPTDKISSATTPTTIIPDLTAEPGAFYPLPPLTPQLYGAAVSAIAYDTEFQAMYVASHCHPTTSPNHLSGMMTTSTTTTTRGNSNYHPTLTSSSMLVTHSTKDGMLYSSCAGHPQASSNTLQLLYQLLYQGTTGMQVPSRTSVSNPAAATAATRIPSHAYRPPYGRSMATQGGATTTPRNHDMMTGQHMGISQLFSLGSQQVASVSPSAVRMHTQGGLCLADHAVEGMLCGTISGSGHNTIPTHMLVGGLSIINNNSSNTTSSAAGNNVNHTTNNTSHSWNSNYQRQSHYQQPQQQVQQPSYPAGHVHMLDLWQGLRVVVSRTLYRSGNNTNSNNNTSVPLASDVLAVTSMATTLQGSSILAGCSDGFVRMLDGRSLREVAKVKSHAGGVVQVATDDGSGRSGTLMATTGFAIRGGSPQYHAYPDTTVLVYDVRYLGRGGIPHPFSGMQGGPRYLTFLPNLGGGGGDDSNDEHHSRLLVASGQAGGGVQIIHPFQPPDAATADPTNDFFMPPLDRGEAITAMYLDPQDVTLALGTSLGNVLQYKMSNYPSNRTIHRSTATVAPTVNVFVPGQGLISSVSAASHESIVSHVELPDEEEEETKQLLEIPSYLPEFPALSLEGSLLQYDETGSRLGATDKIKSVFTSYIMCADPKLSALGLLLDDHSSSMGILANQRIISAGRRKVASTLLQQAANKTKDDFLVTVPIAQLKVDLMENHQRPPPPPSEQNRPYASRQQQQQQNIIHRHIQNQTDPFPNPNKLLFANKLNSLCYEPSLNHRRKGSNYHSQRKDRLQSRGSSSEDDSTSEDGIIPPQYRLTVRPSFKAAGTFDHSHYNDTGLWPGWDYPPTMPNAFASSVLMLLYFVPEVRAAALKAQFNSRPFQSTAKMEKALSPELGFLFHQIDSRSRHAMSYPIEGNDPATKSRIGAWFPSNFLTTLAVLPEAEALQILDGSPAAVETPRRPEAFLRFMLYQLDKELAVKKDETKLMDSLTGIDFVSINEFITGSGPPTQNCTRALSVDMAYDRFLARREPHQNSKPRFGELLRHSLCRETRLRAWNTVSKSYETIVQRKIATSLPSILSLSCACAGRKEEDGLFVWRGSEGSGCFLPDMVEVELEEDGNVVVNELMEDEQGSQTWIDFRVDTTIPTVVSSIVSSYRGVSKRKQRYRLEAVLSFVRDDLGDNEAMTDISAEKQSAAGHHILHMRVGKAYQARSLNWQVREVERLTKVDNTMDSNDEKRNRGSMVLTGATNREVYQQRREHLQKRVSDLEQNKKEWILANGFVVSDTIGEDARAFHVLFKEPCLVIFRSVDEEPAPTGKNRLAEDPVVRIPPDVFQTKSLSTGKPPLEPIKSFDELPKAGDRLALDAEFVSVQDEQTTLNETGQKSVVQETRHSVARISIVDCRTGRVLVDDHVLPREPIVDCLTRFSGIVPADLDPKQSPHHLVSTRSAYLKLRYLVEVGCIFVGHGLSQDFWQMNLVVPPDQIIDTVHIFHQDRMRYISLRFLANYVLHRDMQQDTHDSVEDAKAAYDLYRKAAELKRDGTFDRTLRELYEYGQKTDWKVGMDDPR